MIDIVQHIIDKAELLGWQSFVSKDNMVDREISDIDYRDGKDVLYMTLPTIKRLKDGEFYTNDIEFVFDLMLCRKFEQETYSNVGESPAEKYNNRLYELSNLLDAFLVSLSISCTDHVNLDNTPFALLTNKFSVSLDAVATTITLTAWAQLPTT
jgi:hypothetical protein